MQILRVLGDQLRHLKAEEQHLQKLAKTSPELGEELQHIKERKAQVMVAIETEEKYLDDMYEEYESENLWD